MPPRGRARPPCVPYGCARARGLGASISLPHCPRWQPPGARLRRVQRMTAKYAARPVCAARCRHTWQRHRRFAASANVGPPAHAPTYGPATHKSRPTGCLAPRVQAASACALGLPCQRWPRALSPAAGTATCAQRVPHGRLKGAMLANSLRSRRTAHTSTPSGGRVCPPALLPCTCAAPASGRASGAFSCCDLSESAPAGVGEFRTAAVSADCGGEPGRSPLLRVPLCVAASLMPAACLASAERQ